MTAAIIWSGAGSANSSNYEILRTTAGIIQTVPSGKSNKMRVAGVDHLTVGADGNGWDWHLGRVDSSAYGRIWCVSSNQDVNLDVPTGGVAHVRVGTVDKLLVDSGGVKPQGTGGTGHVLRQTSANGAISSGALTPSDMPAGASQGGTSHAADATWRNQYSLAAGTHTGLVWVTDDFGAATLYTLNGTTITWFYNYGSNSWGSADSTHRHLRVSGGYIQVYNGTGLATANVSTFFMGTVR